MQPHARPDCSSRKALRRKFIPLFPEVSPKAGSEEAQDEGSLFAQDGICTCVALEHPLDGPVETGAVHIGEMLHQLHVQI